MVTTMIDFIKLLSPKSLPKRSAKWNSIERKYLELHPFCSSCKTTINLNVHHILPFHLFPEFELDMNNLLTLCRICHFLWGHGKDWKAYEPNVLNIIVYPEIKTIEYVKTHRVYTKDNTLAKSLVDKLTKGQSLK
jgi:hypothetical protein